MRRLLLTGALALALVPAAHSQISVGIGVAMPGLSIGINVPAYPQLVQVPGYPVYYDPGASANYFFYDGLFWVFADDNWYASDWYDGPWRLVEPEFVPVYVLRVPVRYYRRPPVYFRGWAYNAPPRWGVHWGPDWERRHSGWDHWNHRAVPAPAPLPHYQRDFRGDRYPHDVARQQAIRADHYRFEPRDPAARQQFHGGEAARERPQPAQPRAFGQPVPQAQPQPYAQPQPQYRQVPQEHRLERGPQPAPAQPGSHGRGQGDRGDRGDRGGDRTDDHERGGRGRP